MASLARNRAAPAQAPDQLPVQASDAPGVGVGTGFGSGEGRGNRFMAEQLGLDSSPPPTNDLRSTAAAILGDGDGLGEGTGEGEGEATGTESDTAPAEQGGEGGGEASPESAAGPPIQVHNLASAGGSQTRTSVGVGEETQFSFSGDDWGTWSASDGRGSFADGYFNWTAGSTAGSVTITGTTEDGRASTVTMTVVVPATVTGANPSSEGQPAGAAGAGMMLDLIIGPTDVSFSGIQWAEVAGPASNLQGYFEGKTPPSHTPAPPSHPGPGNVIRDHASFRWDGGRPWAPGSYDWVIPNQWTLGGSGPQPITDVTQRQEILDVSGAGRVSKAGVSSG